MKRIRDIRALMDYIKSSAPLHEQIGRYITLQKDGAGWSALCPFPYGENA
jgi:DNA primase